MRLPTGMAPSRASVVLALDLSHPVVDDPAPGPLARLVSARRLRLRELIDAVHQAAADDRVRALLARVDWPADSWAHADELRGAIAAFRRTGKPAVAHARSFGELGDGTLAYYVAAGFDEIHLQPSGDVGLLGLAAEVPFVAGLLAKIDVIPQIDRRHEYKTAANLVTERAFTQAHREAVERIVASRYEQLVAAIAAGRGMDEDRIAEFVDGGPLLGADALAAGLVDRLAFRDETVAAVKAAAGAGARLQTVAAFRAARRRRPRLPRRRPVVALVHGSGSIGVGRSRRIPGAPTIGADTMATAFQQAIRDRRVRAILFRVDSPGGSAVASDAIWRAVVRAREAGKPVVVSMGSVAGSGGYWVSMAADRIVAAPGTLTGSIGVVAGKFVTRGLRERLGVTSDEAHRGAHALMFSATREFTPEQWERVGAFLDRVYDLFVAKVANGRGLTREQVSEVARGRVWTGADAAERGLVDELGGYREALAAIRELIGLAADAPVRLRVLPRQRLLERVGARQPVPEEVTALARATTEGLRSAGLLDAGAARMPAWAARLR